MKAPGLRSVDPARKARSDRPRHALLGGCSVAAASVLTGFVVVLSVAVGAVPAAAGVSLSTPQMTVTASTSTLVGLQVFANVNLTGGTNPTGTETFKLFGPADPTCTSAVFASTVAVSGTSFNSDRFTTTMAGTYRWQATYNGDSNNNAVGPTSCGNPAAAVIVGQRDVGLSVTAQAPAGGALRAVATVGGVGPTGTVTFYLWGPSDTFCSGTPLFSSTVTVNGTGSYPSAAYAPTTTGTYRWRAGYSGDPNNFGGAYTACLDQNAAVTVTTLGGSAVAAFSPANVSFGPQIVGTVSTAQTVTLTNTGTVGLAISSVNLSGSSAGDFRAVGACSGTMVSPGGSCSVSVSYAPGVVGNSAASLIFTDNASPNSQSVTLSGQSAPDRARFSYPSDGQTGVDTAKAFTWSTTPAAQGYFLMLGTTFGGDDLAFSGVLPPTQTSYQLVALPSGTIYGTLYTEVNGAWSYDTITFTAIPKEARLTYPTSGQTNVASMGAFTWTPTPGVQGYLLTIGTTWGGYDVLNTGFLPPSQTSYTVPALPKGALSAVLYTWTSGGLGAQAITFTTA